jgi:ABC-type Fe3+/spermidine/putrescine transport system ATPase subunit
MYVTHDQGEALTMSDRIAVMRGGMVEQVGTPREVYEQPRTHFVTDFIGESNILPVRVIDVDQQYARLKLDGFSIAAPRRDQVSPGQQLSLVIRPEHILLSVDAERHELNQLRGRVTKQLYHGSLIRYELRIGEHSLVAESQNILEQKTFPLGAEVTVAWHPASCSMLLD